MLEPVCPVDQLTVAEQFDAESLISSDLQILSLDAEIIGTFALQLGSQSVFSPILMIFDVKLLQEFAQIAEYVPTELTVILVPD
jgi:hypothetical protein